MVELSHTPNKSTKSPLKAGGSTSDRLGGGKCPFVSIMYEVQLQGNQATVLRGAVTEAKVYQAETTKKEKRMCMRLDKPG